jgi:hypothetical protein
MASADARPALNTEHRDLPSLTLGAEHAAAMLDEEIIQAVDGGNTRRKSSTETAGRSRRIKG